MAAIRISLSHYHWSIGVLLDSIYSFLYPSLLIDAVKSTGFLVWCSHYDALAMSSSVELQAQLLQSVWRPCYYVIMLQIIAYNPVP
jgi:hypothetical protein